MPLKLPVFVPSPKAMKAKAKRFLLNFGIQWGESYKPLTLKQYELVVTTARRWHGREFQQYIMDCFDPEGGPILAGYEDSCKRYRFNSTE